MADRRANGHSNDINRIPFTLSTKPKELKVTLAIILNRRLRNKYSSRHKNCRYRHVLLSEAGINQNLSRKLLTRTLITKTKS